MQLFINSLLHGLRDTFLSFITPKTFAWNWGPVDTTEGFFPLPLDQSHYHILRPYDVPEDQRYSFINGVHKCWVYSTDKTHTRTSQTKPRTKIARHTTYLLTTHQLCRCYRSLTSGYGYSSGVWQFEGYGYVPNGTSGVCIMQVFGASPPLATTIMIRGPVLEPNIYDRWFRLNVIHNVDAARVSKVYVDVHLKLVAEASGGNSHAFKCGVYAQNDYSGLFMESRWKGIKVVIKKM
ncbi:hypothetical protein I3842_03G126300 [Carya illinoinensis]|uniref:Alginate lyase 2 domain-containing protein n=1 Tax=Carya illinoinensis TaxID=32201 RepID=A0A922FGN1_CARIL|nr:hypothetical protein I3842_03G126300 [Carya illinoinensis]